MIRIDQIPFETVDRAFDFVSEMDAEVRDRKLSNSIRFEAGGNWSLAVYSADRVEALAWGLRHFPENPEFQKAYAEELELLEICDGDCANPRYVALTPDVDVGGLKREWLHGYCAAHGLAIEDGNPDICPADAFEQGLEQALRQAAGEGREAPLAGLAQMGGQNG